MPDASDIKLHVSVIIRRADGLILLVQEAKPENYGKWNLPGGHLEFGETLSEGALREAREETGLQITLAGMLGIYHTLRPGYHAMRFVYVADAFVGEPAAGDQILAVRWATPGEFAALPPGELMAAAMVPRIVRDLERGQLVSLAAIDEQPY